MIVVKLVHLFPPILIYLLLKQMIFNNIVSIVADLVEKFVDTWH